AAESGKSTFIKQMKIIYGEEFSDTELDEYRQQIYINIVRCLHVLLHQIQLWNIPLSYSEQSSIHIRQFYAFKSFITANSNKYIDSKFFSEKFAPCLKLLWMDKAIQETFQRRNEFQITDSFEYFCENIDRIGSLDYVPSHTDILYSRKSSLAVVEYNVSIRNQPFVFIDVGGQRSQRHKWLNCF
ncbi:unnamed protein product, partial [Didymodactylos carnosus]